MKIAIKQTQFSPYASQTAATDATSDPPNQTRYLIADTRCHNLFEAASLSIALIDYDLAMAFLGKLCVIAVYVAAIRLIKMMKSGGHFSGTLPLYDRMASRTIIIHGSHSVRN
jgi:hypothetical protein